MEGWIIHKSLDKHFLQTMAVVVGMSFTIITVALGILYLFETGLPMPAPFIILIFATGFILGNVFLERRGAVYPWSLVGGAIASTILTFIIISLTGGILYVATGGLSAVSLDTVIYSISACMIISMVTLNLASYKFQYT
jgi:hypothetical protein